MARRWNQQDVLILSTIDQLKALAHPERLALLGLLTSDQLTGTQAAEKLGVPANRAQYHLQQLIAQDLVREVAKGRKRWKEERFFLATARQFVVDPNLACQDPKTARAITQSINQAVQDWREREILGVDLGELAQRVVHHGLRTKPGDVVGVMFGPQGIEFAEALIVELEAVGAIPRLKTWSRNYLFRTLDRHTPESLSAIPFFYPDELADLDGQITISTGIPQGEAPNESQRAKLPVLLDKVSEWHQQLRKRRIPYFTISLLQRGMLHGCFVSTEEAINRYWECIAIDANTLGKRAEELIHLIGPTKTLQIKSDSGTDFTVDVDLATAHVNNGSISEQDLKAGRSFDRIPAGSLILLPVEGSARGQIVGDYCFLAKRFRDVSAEVQDGKIESLDAAENADWLRDRVLGAAGEGGKCALVKFGLNPAGGRLTGHNPIDECFAGVVSVSFGNNEVYGGNVSSTVDLSMVAAHASVRAGEQVLIENGKLRTEVDE